MTARTHDLFAFACLLTLASFYPPSQMTIATVFIALIAVIVGALIPDLDQASNRLWDMIPAGDFIAAIADKLFLKHRTFSHSLLGTWFLYFILNLILPRIFNPGYVNIEIIIMSIMIGFISHLALDSLTKEGIPLLFPISWNIGIIPIKSFRIKTDGIFEKFIIFPGIIIYLFWFISTHQQSLLHLVQDIK